MTRNEAREILMQILYEMDASGEMTSERACRLADKHFSGKCTAGNLDFSCPRIRIICIHTHTDRSVPISGSGINMQPVLADCHGPTTRSRYLKRLGRLIIPGERQSGGVHRKRILSRSFLAAAGHHGEGCNQYPEDFFHNSRLIGRRASGQGRPPEKD